MLCSSTEKISFGLFAMCHDERDEALAKNEKNVVMPLPKMHDKRPIFLSSRVLDDTRSSHKMWRGKRWSRSAC